ncbi:MAG: metallophosphoesterase family protein [Candidatus Promineifilaceae bacterium]|nr:metallophosphoesterase family protein [Candidatus Promineifilaceae bacterium]
MAIDKGALDTQLTRLWQDPALRILEARDNKYAIISDLHLGNGARADDFRHNEKALLKALKRYEEEGYTLILLGDVEEFWQFDLDQVVARYDASVYAAIRAFGDERVIRLYGNHDYEWGGFVDPIRAGGRHTGQAAEALKLRDVEGNVSVFMVHGHQGSVDADKFSWFSRFFVRIFAGIEPLTKHLGLFGHGSSTKSSVTKDYERIYYTWAKHNKVIVICGHSHRAIFASRSYYDRLSDKRAELLAENARGGLETGAHRRNQQTIDRLERSMADEKERGRMIEPVEATASVLPCYFNSGCGLYSDGITALEIEEDIIRLVKWDNQRFFGSAHHVFHEGKLSEFARVVQDR